MELLLNAFKLNVGKNPLFSDTIIIDFYDGPTEAICQIRNINEWFISSLVYFNSQTDQRIFSMIKITEEWLSDIRIVVEKYEKGDLMYYSQLKDRIALHYAKYSDVMFLFKSNWLMSPNYEIIEAPLQKIKYFNSIDAVLDQDDESQSKWIDLFQIDA